MKDTPWFEIALMVGLAGMFVSCSVNDVRQKDHERRMELLEASNCAEIDAIKREINVIWTELGDKTSLLEPPSLKDMEG